MIEHPDPAPTAILFTIQRVRLLRILTPNIGRKRRKKMKKIKRLLDDVGFFLMTPIIIILIVILHGWGNEDE